MNSTTKKIFNFALLPAGALAIMLVMTAAGGGFPVKLNPFIKNLKTQLTAYNDYKPQDRVYLQFDKPFYNPGDDIWFSAYVRDAMSMQKSQKSDILHVELINPKGNVQKRIKLTALKGVAKGDFHLDESLAGGIYKVKAYTKWQDNEKDGFVFEKELQVQKVVLPNLKMKLEFDRKAYGSGDEVTASLDLQTNANQPLSDHSFNYIASLDGQQLKTLQGKTDGSGKAKLKFQLPDGLKTNDGLVNVMIEFQGLTESISRSIPILLNTIDLKFYPEGGDLVAALRSRVGFRALNEFGKPADIEGVVIDDQGAEVGTFKSHHQGMGAFDFYPGEGRTYHAKVTRPVGVDQTYELPEAIDRGYILNVARNDQKELGIVIRSTESEAMSLVAQVRGEVYWASEVGVTRGETKVNLPLSKFPIGVCQLTLFDSKGIARAERMAFVNRDKQMNVEIKTNKEKYLPREKVKMTVKVTDERGMPMPAQLSMAVVNDQLLSFADDKSGTILSQLLLEPDLKQKVEEPRFYFDKQEAKSMVALDHLMMTSGWRRFVWEEVLTDRLPTLVHQGERATVTGTVFDAYTYQPIPHASISAPQSQMGLLSDKTGKFTITQMDLAVDNQLIASADNYGDQPYTVANYGQHLNIYLYPNRPNRPMGGADFGEDDFMVEEAEAVEMDAVAIVAEAPQPQMERAMAAAPVMRADVVQIAGARNNRGRKRMKAKGGMGNAAKKAPAMRMGANKPMDRPKADVAPRPDANKDFKALAKNEAKEMVADGIVPRDQNAQQEQPGQPGDNLLDDADDDMNGFMDIASGTVVDARFAQIAANDKLAEEQRNQPAQFYRAREFSAPVYTDHEAEAPFAGKRSDFRSTIYWNPVIEVDRTGKAVIEFYCSDEISSFRTVVEGIAHDGGVGRQEFVYYTQLPFSMATRVPTEVATNDRLTVPVVLTNNTNLPMTGALHVMPPSGLKPLSTTGETITIPAGRAKTVNLVYEVLQKPGEEAFDIAFASQGHTDAFTQPLKIVSQGFPVNLAFSGNETTSSYEFRVKDVVPGSITAQFTAYPNVVSDLVKGIESILREPYGCFEQTSTSSYPNAMVMSYMLEQDEVDPKIMKRAKDLLNKGYKRLTTFECSQNGYEWFGSNPPHEALTAYGLMQFNDYSAVMDGVDQKMVQRTAKWLMKRRDGNGGFKQDKKALDTFGRAPAEIANAYIVYALSEAGFKEIMLEANTSFDKAMSSKDPYQLALVASTMHNLGKADKAKQAVSELLKTQAANGSFTGTKTSITSSRGQSLTVETTALAVIALIKTKTANAKALQGAVKSIVKVRSGHGGFGSTQATILALKSLVEYAKFSKKTDEAGTIEIYVDGTKVAEQAYEAGHKDAIEIAGLGAYISEGTHTMEVKFKGAKNALPYSIGIDYHTNLPSASPKCVVNLDTKLSETNVKMGSTVRLSATLENVTDEGQPMTMAIIGLPAGLSAQPWQLKEMQEKKVFDFYEIVGNNVVAYYRQMKPGETRNINLDLKADIPGTYTAPASSAYLYYTAEDKDWTALPAVTIVN